MCASHYSWQRGNGSSERPLPFISKITNKREGAVNQGATAPIPGIIFLVFLHDIFLILTVHVFMN